MLPGNDTSCGWKTQAPLEPPGLTVSRAGLLPSLLSICSISSSHPTLDPSSRLPHSLPSISSNKCHIWLTQTPRLIPHPTTDEHKPKKREKGVGLEGEKSMSRCGGTPEDMAVPCSSLAKAVPPQVSYWPSLGLSFSICKLAIRTISILKGLCGD